ncbi:glycosyltransferase [Nodosilinea sp. E11]|uniref:glycosyltransferase family protein n=1 Tax=Nodosilinea sp. E11 TaxID=3037479 RepID=UPI002934D7EC|nr:glycosyltransferase [Nodosilinea sp. E11]WOD39159.1 glycosyltransferase [Nodosilinea sp. E11]
MKKAIIIGPKSKKSDPISIAQINPFYQFRSSLKKELGLSFEHFHAVSISEIENVIDQRFEADTFFVRPQWSEKPKDLERIMKKMRDVYPNSQIFLIDPFDQTSSRFFSVLPYVTRLIKYICLKDKSLYIEDFIGGNFCTDKLVNEMGYNLNGWHVGSQVPDGYENHIVPGWYALCPKLKKQILTPFPPRFLRARRKDIDVFSHVSCGNRIETEWYGLYRQAAIDVLNNLKHDYNLSINADYIGEPRISRLQYQAFLRRSKIAFSPLGWGEITMRSYEAVLNKCLLIQPNVDHVIVEPNIFIPYETYIPVEWDYRDLEEKCRYYLNNPREANQIVENAYTKFKEYFISKKFVARIGELLAI